MLRRPICSKTEHPSLPDIVDVIDEDDRFLIVMDYIEGNSLKTALQEYGAQSQKNVIKVGQTAMRCSWISALTEPANHIS